MSNYKEFDLDIQNKKVDINKGILEEKLSRCDCNTNMSNCLTYKCIYSRDCRTQVIE